MSAVEIRRACRKYAEKFVDLQRTGFQAAGRARAVGRSVPDDERAVPIGDRRRVCRFSGPRLRLQGPEAGALVHARTARRWRKRKWSTQTTRSPSIWVRFALTSRPGGDRPGAGGPQGLRADLDHHAVDDAGEHGDRLQPEVRVRGGGCGAATVYIVAADLVKVTAEKCGWRDYQVIATFPGRARSKARCSTIRSWSAIRWAFWPTT